MQTGMNTALGRPEARVVALVVTYHPQARPLQQLLRQLQPQVHATIVVDNTGTPTAVPELPASVLWLTQPRNLGIGAAQNLGIAQARRLQASHVLLMDQDSLPPENMVQQLLLAASRLQQEQAALRLAAIGPVCHDIKTQRPHLLIRRRGWRIRRLSPDGQQAPIKVDYMPASGSLIELRAIDHIGSMDEDYFIDRVDVQWGLRARKQGWELVIVPSVVMQHDQGLRAVHWLGRTLYAGADWRAYYHVRNSLHMALRAPIDWTWRIDQLLKIPGYCLFHLLTAQDGRWAMLRSLAAAIRDGLGNRLGQSHKHRPPPSPRP